MFTSDSMSQMDCWVVTLFLCVVVVLFFCVLENIIKPKLNPVHSTDTPESRLAKKIKDAINLGVENWALVDDMIEGVMLKSKKIVCVHPLYSTIIIKHSEDVVRPYIYLVGDNDITQYIPQPTDFETYKLIEDKKVADEQNRLQYILAVVEGGALSGPPLVFANQPSAEGLRLFNAFKKALEKDGWIACEDFSCFQYSNTSMQIRCFNQHRLDAWVQKSNVNAVFTYDQHKELAMLAWKKWHTMDGTQTKLSSLINYAESIV